MNQYVLYVTVLKHEEILFLQNKKLIAASNSGDVVRVTSLLNSGADIQTEDEVAITDTSVAHLWQPEI